MAGEEAARMGVMLEQLNARFELVVEAMSGLGGRIDSLRAEMFEQFAEVGNQIRFLSHQIGENREGLASLRADLTAEAVRLGETLGATRVEFRQQLAETKASLSERIARTEASLRQEIADSAKRTVEQLRSEMHKEIGETRDGLRKEIAEKTEAGTKQLSGEIKQTQKSLGALSKKFDRFDDRVSVQVKDHEQWLRKLGRQARG